MSVRRCRCGGQMPGFCPGPAACPMEDAAPMQCERCGSDSEVEDYAARFGWSGDARPFCSECAPPWLEAIGHDPVAIAKLFPEARL